MTGQLEMKRIGDVCDVIAGQSPESKYYNSDEYGLPFYQGKKEFNQKYIGKPTVWTTKITKEAFAGDILMSVRAPVGPVNFSRDHICIGRGLAAIRAKEDIDREYLFYFLLHYESKITGNTGAVFNSINKNQIANIVLPVPNIHEQKQIVAILDKAFAAIDQAKANVERNLKNARELFQSKLNEVFEQKGEGWVQKRFKEVCVLQRGFDLPKRLRKKGPYALVSSSGIIDTHQVFKIKAPGVVTGRSGSIGSVFYIENDFWPLNTVLYIKDFKSNYEKFIYYFLKYFDLSKYASGAGVPTLNRNFVHDEIVTVSEDTKTQKRIVQNLESVGLEVSKLEAQYSQKIIELDQLKKSILQKAFNGELNITDA